MKNEHWNGPEIKKLYSWSWSCQHVLANFLFSEVFNREYFSQAFMIYLYFCQKHTPKSCKFNVLPNFTFGKESCLVPWRAIYTQNVDKKTCFFKPLPNVLLFTVMFSTAVYSGIYSMLLFYIVLFFFTLYSTAQHFILSLCKVHSISNKTC